jgi:hypothetical protein
MWAVAPKEKKPRLCNTEHHHYTLSSAGSIHTASSDYRISNTFLPYRSQPIHNRTLHIWARVIVVWLVGNFFTGCLATLGTALRALRLSQPSRWWWGPGTTCTTWNASLVSSATTGKCCHLLSANEEEKCLHVVDSECSLTCDDMPRDSSNQQYKTLTIYVSVLLTFEHISYKYCLQFTMYCIFYFLNTQVFNFIAWLVKLSKNIFWCTLQLLWKRKSSPKLFLDNLNEVFAYSPANFLHKKSDVRYVCMYVCMCKGWA